MQAADLQLLKHDADYYSIVVNGGEQAAFVDARLIENPEFWGWVDACADFDVLMRLLDLKL